MLGFARSPRLVPLAAALCAAACGRSDLAKAYDAYEPKVEPLLAAEAPRWKRLADLYNEQRDGAESLPRLAEFLRTDAVPFYARLQSDVDALAPGDPGLDAAHARLRAFAAKRREFAETVAASLDALGPSAAEEELDRRSRAADLAKQRYGESLTGAELVADGRAGSLNGLAQSFQRDVMAPYSEGRIGAEDVEREIRGRILPEVRRLRDERWEDDESSRLLRQAVVAAEEFYACVAEKLPEMHRRATTLQGARRAADEGDRELVAFREALAEVRRRR